MNNPHLLRGPSAQAAEGAKKVAVVAEIVRKTGSAAVHEVNAKKKGNEAVAGDAKKGSAVAETARKIGSTAQESNAKKKGNEVAATTKPRTSNTMSSSKEAIPSTTRVDAKELSKHVKTLRERIYRAGAPVRFVKLLNDVCTSYGVRSLHEIGLSIDAVDELRDLRQLEGLVEMQVMISNLFCSLSLWTNASSFIRFTSPRLLHT